MAKKTININQPQDFINIGSAPNSKDGDSLRAAFARLNDAIDNIDSNFSELYTAVGQPVDGNLKTDIVGSVFADDSSVIVDSIDSKVTANTVTGGSIRISGHTIDTVDSSSIVIDQAVTVSSDLTVGGDVIPSVANGGNLGSLAKPFKSLYVSNSTVFFGGVPLAINQSGQLTVNGSQVGGSVAWNDVTGKPTIPSVGDITFANSTVSAGNEDEIIVQAKDINGFATARLSLEPVYSNAQLSAYSAETVETFTLANGDFATGIWQNNGFGNGVVAFTGAQNIGDFFQNTLMSLTAANVSITINSEPAIPWNGGFSGSGTDTPGFGTNPTVPASPITITSIVFRYRSESFVRVNQDSTEIRLKAQNADIRMDADLNIQMFSDGQIELQSGENFSISSGQDISISTGSSDTISISTGDLNITAFDDVNFRGSDSFRIRNTSATAPIRIITDDNNTQKTWAFNPDGNLTLPGNLQSEGDISIEINLADSTRRIWRFGEDGDLRFPDGTVQSSAGISASSTDTLTNKTINIQAGQGNVFQIQGNSITSYSGSGAVLALTSMPTFSGMNVNNSSLSIDGGSGSFYANTAFADGAGTIHKAGVYKSANNANNALFTFGANGAGTMSVVMDGSLFIGSALPANNGGLNTDYGGWLVVQAGAKFGGDLNTIGNFILDTPGNYVRFGDGTTQTTAADFGYLDLDKDTIKGTSDYQYTFATDGYFTASTSSESPNYFFVAYNTTNANIAAGWTVVGGTANTTVSSVTYPVAGYPGVIRVNLTAAASSTSGFYPVTVTSPDRLRVEIQPNPGTSDKFAFTTSGLTFPDATVQTTAYTGLQTSLVGAVDNNVLIRTSETVVTNNLYTNTTDFSTDVDIGGGTIISGWLQRNSEQIEISLFGPGAFRTYLTGLSLGRTVTVTYSTASGNQTLTRPLTQIFANIAQEDPNNPGWTRVAGRIDATLPVNQTGIVSINFPVTTTPQYDWTFSDTGNLTVPGELHGAPVISGGAFPSQVGRTVNITPADDASDKKFKFRIDQYGETFTRAYLEFPTAEVDKQVAAVFPHTNGKAGYIYTQGADTNGQGMNDAFNIFYNSGDIKITSMGLSGGLYTWKFGDSGDLTIPGGIRSESNINIDINLSDSTLRRWRFGEDGDLTFPDSTVQTTAYTGNAATVDVMNTNGIDYNYSITFVENRSTTQDLRADVDLTFNSWSNTLTAGNVTTGVLKIEDGVHEKFQTKSNATGTVTHDCSSGHIFYHTLPSANWTVNLTNLNLAVGYATTVTLVIEQGATGYYPNAVQIDGNAVGLAWQGNTTPTPSSSRTDVVTFSILYDGLYTVLGQLTGF